MYNILVGVFLLVVIIKVKFMILFGKGILLVVGVSVVLFGSSGIRVCILYE